jgi:GxxExxY protein
MILLGLLLRYTGSADLAPVHESQVIAYLKASGLGLGLLLNFGQQRIQTRRIIP